MTDRILLANIRAEGRHGVLDWEQREAQPFEVDVELVLDLQPAGRSDRLEETVDYGRVDEIVRRHVTTTSHALLEALAESIGAEILADAGERVTEVGIRIRKPAVRLGGPLDYAAVEIRRRPPGA